jgi:hypothetical protein
MTSVPASILALEAFIAIIILLRSITNYRGRRLSPARLLTSPVLVSLLYVAAEAETAYAIPWSFPLWTAIDVALLLAAVAVTVPLAPRLVSVYRGPDGSWMYRYGIELIAFYLTVWVVRLVLAVYYDPSSLEFTVGGPVPTLSATASDVMQVVEILLSVSTGLVIGRAVATYRLYRRAVAQAGSTPGPLP